ncbi:hypothetical protein CCACVL1_28071 [Corchorus capsularis]|uniref:F-box domain-containing protein n=1 Tax=Corchorus capsularis TaxID=210143 RepID=A0A1R3G7S5_COCAP|nr:hypothetical protein CCACVL1_28071 [Corchorus capsularis]
MDRISDLPPDIIHQIMSHLSAKQVAQTTLLSKQWKDYLRPSFPILVFSHFDFIDYSGKEETEECDWFIERVFELNIEKFQESMKGFTEFIDATLDRFCKMKLRMDKFKLIIGTTRNSEPWSCLVDKWIGLALENQVKDLTLQIFHDQLYLLPETVFSTKSITNAFNFHSLKKLKLVEVNLDELMIQKLTGQSPSLEVIDLNGCEGFADCHVPELPRLKKFIMSTSQDLKSIQIVAPNLHYFDLFYSKLERPLFRINCPNGNLRDLKLYGNLIEDDHTFQDLISKCPLLEGLRIRSCDTLSKVTISSQRLKQLEFSECNELEAVHIDTPNLLGFCFECTQVPIASINAPCPWEISFGHWNDNVDTHWYLKLQKFLGTSKHIQKLRMRTFYFEEVYKALAAATRDHVNCCSDSFVKCWRHYLKDVKFLSFEGGILSWGKRYLDGDALMKAWPNLPQGVVHFALEWCFDVDEA